MKIINWSIWLPMLAIILLTIEVLMEFVISDQASWSRFLSSIKETNPNGWLIIPAMIISGIIIGALRISKHKFGRRVSVATGLIFIGFSLFFITRMTLFYYGLNESLNYFTAKEDIKNGKIRFYTYGQMHYSSDREYYAIDSLEKSYGYEVIDAGGGTPGLEIYNDVVEDYLTKIHGKNWRDGFNRKIDSIYKSSNSSQRKIDN